MDGHKDKQKTVGKKEQVELEADKKSIDTQKSTGQNQQWKNTMKTIPKHIKHIDKDPKHKNYYDILDDESKESLDKEQSTQYSTNTETSGESILKSEDKLEKEKC